MMPRPRCARPHESGPGFGRLARGILVLVLLALLLVSPAQAQNVQPAGANPQPPFLKDIGIDQKLGTQVPLDLPFRDEDNRPIQLRDLIHDKPVILTLVYYNCPMLCTLVLNDLTRSARILPQAMGVEYEVVTVSFDPHDTPAIAKAKKANYVRAYERPGAARGWHFLTGTPEAIRALTQAVGFRYAWDEKAQQFMHPGGVMILTPHGQISRYFFGVDYDPTDLRLALVQASNGTIGTPTDRILLFCYHYDPATGRYTLAITRLLRLAGILTVLLIAAGLLALFWSDRRRSARLLARAALPALSVGAARHAKPMVEPMKVKLP